MKNKIIFNGYYGFQNSGDDAFVEISAWGNKHYWNNQNPAYFIGNELPQTNFPIKRVYPDKNKNRILQKLSVFSQALDTNYFINAGGSVFSKITPLSDIVFAEKAGIFNKKMKHGNIGVSIGPFQSIKDEKRIIEYLKKSSFLALRDAESYAYAKSIDLDYEPVKAFDLAALLPECFAEMTNDKIEDNNKETKVIGVSLCNYERYVAGDLEKEEKRNKFVEEVLKILAQNKNIHFKFFIFNGNKTIGDEELTHKIIAKLPSQNITVVPYLNSVKSVWDEVKSCDFMFSIRLHASVFACYANVPFMLVEYHRKCSDFLEDVGYNEDLRVFDAEKSPKQAANEISSILEGNYNFPDKVEDTKERARLNFTKISL